MTARTSVLIIGTGFAGLGMAIRMKQQGMDDFVVLERAGDVGGTWRDNTYPGAACDVPSNLYSFSFAPNPHWSRTFSAQPEIQAYLQGCADPRPRGPRGADRDHRVGVRGARHGRHPPAAGRDRLRRPRASR